MSEPVTHKRRDKEMTSELLTDAEHRALALTVELVKVVVREVIGHGETRAADVNEFCRNVHLIQHAIMSQAAARAYPSEFRLLGSVIS